MFCGHDSCVQWVCATGSDDLVIHEMFRGSHLFRRDVHPVMGLGNFTRSQFFVPWWHCDVTFLFYLFSMGTSPVFRIGHPSDLTHASHNAFFGANSRRDAVSVTGIFRGANWCFTRTFFRLREIHCAVRELFCDFSFGHIVGPYLIYRPISA